MELAKILIVENESITAANMRMILTNSGYAITDVVASGQAAIESIKKNFPDIVLMDIHLDGNIDGITTARTIRRLFSLPLIFITKLEDVEIFKNAKETFPQNFFTKPFIERTLIHAVEVAIKNISIPQESTTTPETKVDGIFIPTVGGGSIKILFSDILYIEADRSYSKIHYETKEKCKEAIITVSLSSNRVVKQLACPTIIKVHKSYHVNIQKIEEYKITSVKIHGFEIPVTKDYIDELRKKLLFFEY